MLNELIDHQHRFQMVGLDRNVNFRERVKEIRQGTEVRMQRNHFIKWRVSQHQMKNLSPLCNLGDSLVIHISGDTPPEHQSAGISTQIQMG